MSRSLMFRLETKMPNPLMKKESCRVYNCDDEHLSGSTKRWISKVCEMFKVCGIEFLKYIREFYTHCYCGEISSPET